MSELRQITTCAGIGDAIWMMQKLVNAGERFDFVIPDGQPRRGHQLFNLLPQIAASCTYAPNLNYAKIKQNNEQHRRKNWKDITAKKFYLEANTHLEAGKRIEQWLPDLPTTYKLDYATTETDRKAAEKLTPENWDTKYIGVYTSAYSNTRNWNGWGADKWLRLIKLLYQKKNIRFVIIGASFDVGVVEDLVNGMSHENIPYVNTVGQPLSVVVEVLKRLTYFCGFPSGLSILNETLQKDGLMFYATPVKGIINTWADPERIKAGNIKECLFCEPEKIFDWLKNTYQIFEKI